MLGTNDSVITMRLDNGVDWAMLEGDFAFCTYSISNIPFEKLAPQINALVVGELQPAVQDRGE